MKMVAAAKLRRAQDAILQMRPYAQKLNEILQNVSSSEANSPYAEVRPVNKVLIIPVTSDRGLCGAFNTNVFRQVRILVEGEYREFAQAGNLTVMPIGKKAADFYKRRELAVEQGYSNVFTHLSFETAREAAEFAMNSFKNGEFDKVIVVYNEFKNVATQIVHANQLLPLQPAEVATDETQTAIDYIFEPSKEEIVTELIPKSIKIQFYKMLLESNAAEHGARMTAMDKATDNAGELLKELKLMYNRTRQAAITKEILEIVGGAEALAAK